MIKNALSKLLRTLSVLLIFIPFFIQSCKFVSDTASPITADSTSSVITGNVTDYLSGQAVKNATVKILGAYQDVTTQTNDLGYYTSQVQLYNNSNLTIIISKTGYISDTSSIYAELGKTVTASTVQLSTVPGSHTGTPGNPVSIYIQSVTPAVIGVKESGSQETAQLVFVVQDSAGIPMDGDHTVKVIFSIGSGPGGGEFISPPYIMTNKSGQAIVNLTSGTKAGAVQIIAEIDQASGTILSRPVGVTIHGGLPEINHFSISPAEHNFPGYDTYGVTDKIMVFVGDKYANPVKPQTAIYFTTTGGIIEGSALTDNQGIGSVNLISADPKPIDPTLGPGFGTITASTVDENNTTISKTTIVLFSGIPMLSISPTTFNIPNGGAQNFNYTLMDENGNPLAGGTSITVTVGGTNVAAEGDVAVTLPDTQSKTWTNFGFTVYDTADTINVVNPVSIEVSTSGPNGGEHLTISGTSR